MTKRLSLGVVASLLVVALFAFAGFAQTDPRGRSYTLHGTVEGINDFAKSVRVNQGKIEGYSDESGAPSSGTVSNVMGWSGP